MEVLLKNTDFVLVTFCWKGIKANLRVQPRMYRRQNFKMFCFLFGRLLHVHWLPLPHFSFTRHLAGFNLARKVFLRKHHEPRPIFLMEVLLKNTDFVLVTFCRKGIKATQANLRVQPRMYRRQNFKMFCFLFGRLLHVHWLPLPHFSFTRHLAGFNLARKVFLRKHHEPRSYFEGTVGG